MISLQDFSKRIPSYLDGLMSEEERLDFEAIIGSRPDFAQAFRQKQIEQESVAQRVPEVLLSEETQLHLETEMREAIEHLFKDESAAPTKRLKSWFQDLF